MCYVIMGMVLEPRWSLKGHLALCKKDIKHALTDFADVFEDVAKAIGALTFNAFDRNLNETKMGANQGQNMTNDIEFVRYQPNQNKIASTNTGSESVCSSVVGYNIGKDLERFFCYLLQAVNKLFDLVITLDTITSACYLTDVMRILDRIAWKLQPRMLVFEWAAEGVKLYANQHAIHDNLHELKKWHNQHDWPHFGNRFMALLSDLSVAPYK